MLAHGPAHQGPWAPARRSLFSRKGREASCSQREAGPSSGPWWRLPGGEGLRLGPSSSGPERKPSCEDTLTGPEDPAGSRAGGPSELDRVELSRQWSQPLVDQPLAAPGVGVTIWPVSLSIPQKRWPAKGHFRQPSGNWGVSPCPQVDWVLCWGQCGPVPRADWAVPGLQLLLGCRSPFLGDSGAAGPSQDPSFLVPGGTSGCSRKAGPDLVAHPTAACRPGRW